MSHQNQKSKDEENNLNQSFIQKQKKTDLEDTNNPFKKINIFSRLLFFWINPLLKKSHKQSLSQEDIFQLYKKDQSQYNFEKFEHVYEEVKNDPKVKNKIKTIFFRIFKKEIFIVVILYFFSLMSQILNTLSVKMILLSYASPDRGSSLAPLLPGIFLQSGVYIFQSIIKSNYNFYYSQLTVRMTGALSLKIFQKTYQFPMQRNQFYKIGDILNMVQVDILQIVTYIQNLFTFLFVFPFVIFQFYLCYDQIQNFLILLIMIAVCIVTFIINLVFGRWYGSIQKKFMHEKDLRMRSLEEMMRGIKTIKYNNLEDFFDNRIKQKREKEIKQLRLQNLLVSFTNFISNISTDVNVLLITIIFGITSLNEFLTINSTYGSVLGYLSVIPNAIQGIVVGSNSMKRIDNYLTESFIYQQSIDYQKEDIEQSELVIEIKDGNFSWENQIDISNIQSSVKLNKRERLSFSQNNQINAFKIKNLNLKIKKGEYVVFYGDLGSGKSSILQAILGEMEVQGGEKAFQNKVKVNGSISLCTQEPWIIQDTVQENILFGQSKDQLRYKTVLKVCCLEEDIAYFVDGDQTNIGEKGDTLSGGQRKRVNLARSIYKQADIYVMDDPLAALDIGVASQISKECFEGMLKNKTRVIFTNNLVGMSNSDRIFVVKNGEIVDEGNYAYVKRIIQSNLNKDFNEEQDKIEEEKEREQSNAILQNHKKLNQEIFNNNYTKQLIQIEDIQQGYIKFEVFKEFVQDLGGFFFISTLLILLAGFILSNMYSRLVILDVKNDEDSNTQYNIMMLYCLYDSLRLVSILFYEQFIIFRMVSLSRLLHKSIVYKLLRASFTKFYNLITTGRLINRLSKDIYEIDMQIPKDFATVLNNFATIIVSGVTVIMLCNIKTMAIAIFYIFLAIFIAYYFITAKRQIVRIEATSKSPILQYFSEIIRGLQYVRNCVEYQNIKNKFQEYVDIDLRNQIALNGVQYWFECISNFLFMFPILVTLIIVYYETDVSPNTAIMIAVQVTNLSVGFIIFSQGWISFETHFVNFERNIISENYEDQAALDTNQQIKSSSQIIFEVEEEAPPLLDQNFDSISDCKPQSANVDYRQSIIFKNASFQYRKDIPACLKNINIKFMRNEKIGIVGRTGAGKTSITLALTKIIDLVQGDVLINGKSIQTYSLKQLRETISVVSQEPYIFEGSLKLNLDPYRQYSDNEILQTYNQCGFSNCYSFQKGLDTEISQLGDNLSEGEKQLISIGRIILKKSEIIIVDEPTSHIDVQMEEHVTRILNENFKNCLMITIAHKIKTIMGSDKILVLDHGEVQEFDNPNTLLQNKNSHFSGILNMIKNNTIN
ncbi:ABC transporter C family protein (macronuclear) [Tetrahymena thermophila SB210]|uniref:ABC transporter C family protein n=1 Tax=Tetrahymena thermophila (strain SB210) TaxID=312017 RepID=Q23TU5_TETTS|nr:ABC transporter C family protein [Tetrahymena thermophila SB210]EAR99950.2 ABC transporter C family protein [Tetrahymena thermophila SB210]|eukprot:XP_001020195.2 ABC transporter C family protein [Tetrahymena thermophila SB210]